VSNFIYIYLRYTFYNMQKHKKKFNKFLKNLHIYWSYLFHLLQDPRTNGYFLIGSPWLVLILIGFYLYFIYNLGPRLMAKRQPFKLYRILQIYNVSQILLNAYLFYEVSYIMFLNNYLIFNIYKNIKTNIFYYAI